MNITISKEKLKPEISRHVTFCLILLLSNAKDQAILNT